MEQVTFNAVGRYRRETLNGRSYLVVPMTSLVPGVLPGSKGPLYYPPDQVSRNVRAWDGQPLTMYHPTDRFGNPAPAKHDAHTINKHRIGRVRNSVFDGKLKHEAWFNEAKTRNADRRWGTDVYDRIINGRPIELSTGLQTTNVQAPPGYVNHRGERYEGLIAMNYVPDHIAVLPNQTGACSLKDGCGVGVTNMTTNDLADKRSFLSKLAGWLGVTNDQPRHPKDGRYQGHVHPAAKAGFEDTRVVETELDPMEDDDEIEEADTDAPTGNENTSGKCKCGAVLENESDTCMNCMAKNAASCRCGGTCDDCKSKQTTNQEEAIMALTAEAKKAHVDFLVTNCECWKGEHNRKVLNSLPDENLVKLRKQTEDATTNALVVNQLREAFDADLNLVTTNAIPDFIKKKMEAKKGEDEADDSSVVDNDGGNDASFQSVKNSRRPTLAEWEASMPPEAQQTWNHAKTIVSEETARLTAALNAVATKETNPQRKNLIVNRLKAKPPVSELRDLLTLVQPAPTVNAQPALNLFPSYLGAAGGFDAPTLNRDEAGDDVLNTLTMDDIVAEERARKSA